MKTEMRVANPDEVEFELTVSMKLKDWKTLREQLKNEYPSLSIGCEITDMIIQANTKFYPKAAE